MKNCENILSQNKGDSSIGGSIYIDPLGYEYPKSIVTCYKCIFNFSWDSCVFYKEIGFSDDAIRLENRNVEKNNNCEYFLIKDFSEGGNEDEVAREEVAEIARKMNYPSEYWRRNNIHQIMKEKDIGYRIRDNQSCSTCNFYVHGTSDINFCKFHDIEIFTDERYCENYQGDDDNKILTTAALYSKGISYIPLNELLSLKANPNHTFSIVKSSDLSDLYDIEPYLLDSIQFNAKDGFIYANYIFKTDVIDLESKSIVKTISDHEEQREEDLLDLNDEKNEVIDKVDTNQEQEELKKDFEARIKFFTKNFYLDNVESLNAHSKNIKGEIDRISLYISYAGIDDSLLDRIDAILSDFKEKYGKAVSCDAKNFIEEQSKELIELIELQEIISHENFHLLQFLTCESVNTFYKASRKHNLLRYYLLSEIIKQEVKIKPSHDENIFTSILRLKVNDIDYFNEVIRNSRIESMIVKNFYNYKSKKTDLTIIDIFEGAAIAFQKIVNKSEKITTLYDTELTNVKKYFGAWNYFKEKGGNKRVIFFIVAYQSLKYGLLDDGDYMNVVPIPQNIFVMLCENISKYESELNCPLFGTPFFIDSELSKLNLENDKISAIYKLVNIFNIVKEDIRIYSKKVNTYHDDNIFERSVDCNDSLYSPMKAISENICKDYPLFTKDYFVPILLVDYAFYTKFIFSYLPSLLNEIEFNGVSGKNSNIRAENFIFRLVDDIDKLVRFGHTYCCDNHKNNCGDIENVFLNDHDSKIWLCESQDSLKNRYKMVSGKELESLFQWD